LPVSSTNPYIQSVLVAGGLAPKHWLENEQLRAVIDNSSLGQLASEFCSTTSFVPTVPLTESGSDESPVPRFLPHEQWLAAKHQLICFGTLAAQSVIEDWPQYPGDNNLDKFRELPAKDSSINWWRIDPVYCQLATDHIVLGRAKIEDLTLDEAQQLAASLADYCESQGYAIYVAHPQRWYLKWNVPTQPPALNTASSLAAQGRSIQLYLPQNNTKRSFATSAIDHARDWRRLVGEAEVSWFNHSVNTARQANGRLPINSLWLVGPCPVATNKMAIGSIGESTLSVANNAPAKNVVSALLKESLVITEPIQELVNDRAYEWAAAIGAISSEILKPVREQLQARRGCKLILTSDQEILELTLSPPNFFNSFKQRLGISKPTTPFSSMCAQSLQINPAK
jgi:hypothetical protein